MSECRRTQRFPPELIFGNVIAGSESKIFACRHSTLQLCKQKPDCSRGGFIHTGFVVQTNKTEWG